MISKDRSEIEKWQAAVSFGRKPLGLYIHIPFCKKKCRYCDFVSFPGCEGQLDTYVDRLCAEIGQQGKNYGGSYYVDSIFIGGGTPSLLSAEQLGKIVRAVNGSFVCGYPGDAFCGAGTGSPCKTGTGSPCKTVINSCLGPEFTVECNPGTVDEAKFAAMKALGVTRVSLGVQSLSNPVLKKLGRIHDSETALKAMDMAAAAGLDYNVDLMFGVPGQTLGIWKKTLRLTVEKKPSHISFYSLQLEEGTPLYDAYRDGRMDLPAWEVNREMYHFAEDYLKAAGYHHYEISNAALPGKECRHNIKYWTMGEYLGLGLAAYSFVGGKRFYNTADMDRYLLASSFGRYDEAPDETGLKGDWVFTALRLTEGFALEDYAAYFGSSFAADFGEAADSLVADGLLEYYEKDGGTSSSLPGYHKADGRGADGPLRKAACVRMTEKGLDYTNPVMERLLAELEK